MTHGALFGNSGGDVLQLDTGGYTFGIHISRSAAFYPPAVWFYSPPGAAALPATIAVYDDSVPALVHSEAATWSGSAGSGWVRAAFASSPLLSASVSYAICVFYGGGANWYSNTQHYFDTGPGAGGITSGLITAPGNSGISPGQGTINSGASLAYPGGTFNASNWWVDIEDGTSVYLGMDKQAPGAVQTSDSTQYVFGLSFKVTASGAQLDGWRWYCAAGSGQSTAAEDFALWTSTGPTSGIYVTGSKVTSGTFTQGWNFIPCAVPIPLTAGQEYRAVKTTNKSLSSGTNYTFTANFFDTGAGSAGSVNGPLTVFAKPGAASNPEPSGDGQMTFLSGSTDVTAGYPANEFNQTWYGMDVQVSFPVSPAASWYPSLDPGSAWRRRFAREVIRVQPRQPSQPVTCSGTMAMAPMAVSASSAADIMYGAWAFDEGGGSTVFDYSGHGRNMTISGSNSWVAGHGNYVNSFQAGASGSDGAVWNNGAGIAALSGDVTIQLWFRHTAGTSTTNSHAGGLYSAPGTARLACWTYRSRLAMNSSPEYTIRDSAGTIFDYGVVGTVADGLWHNTALVYHSSGLMEEYLDGVLVFSSSPTALPIGTNVVEIGAGSVLSGAAAQGLVQDMRVFSVALSARDIAAWMNTPVHTVVTVPGTGVRQSAGLTWRRYHRLGRQHPAQPSQPVTCSGSMAMAPMSAVSGGLKAITYNTGATSTVNGSGSASGHTMTVPAGVKTGDAVLVQVFSFTFAGTAPVNTLTSTGTAPAQVGSQVQCIGSGIYATSALFSFTAGPGDAGATLTYGCTGGATQFWFDVGLVSYTGAAAVQPDVINGAALFAAGNGSTTTPAAVTALPSDWQVQFLAVGPPSGNEFTGVPAGLTQRLQILTGQNAGLLMRVADSGGSVGPAGTSIGSTLWSCGASTGNVWSTSYTVGLAAGFAPGVTVTPPVTPLRLAAGRTWRRRYLPGAERPLQPGAVPAVISSGTMAMAPMALHASAAAADPSSGSIALAPMALHGQATVTDPSSGSAGLAPMALHGTAQVTSIASGTAPARPGRAWARRFRRAPSPPPPIPFSIIGGAASWSGSGSMSVITATAGPDLAGLWAAYLNAKQLAFSKQQELALARGAYTTDGWAYVLASEFYVLDRAADAAYKKWADASEAYQRELGVFAAYGGGQ